MVELTDDLQHTLVRATEDDLIVLLLKRSFTDSRTDDLDDFMEALAERTGATLAILPHDLVADVANYTISDLLKLREAVDSLIAQRIESFPAAEA